MDEKSCATCKYWSGDRNDRSTPAQCLNPNATYKAVWEDGLEVPTKKQISQPTHYHHRAFLCSKGYKEQDEFYYEKGVFIKRR
jgi:hypothetical protein